MQATTYDVTDRLGMGGYGEVYLATQTIPGGLTRKVAIKVLKKGIDENGDAMRRLLDEGKMLAQLRHPCIVSFHELTTIDGRLALITEYVEGTDLSAHSRKDSLLPERVVWHIGAEISSALDCVWNTVSEETQKALHLIHRDIKPANIRIGRFGEVKLLDFGIARTTEMSRHADTVAGTLPFTPGFVPPEVFLRGEVNHTTDVYALGCTLYRLLTGRRFYKRLDLPDTVALAVSERDYMAHLDERLSHIRRAGGRQLLRNVLAYDLDARPSAQSVSLECEELVDRISGISMRRWARENPPSKPEARQTGPLTGCAIQSGTLPDIAHKETKPPSLASQGDGDLTPVATPHLLSSPETETPTSETPPLGDPVALISEPNREALSLPPLHTSPPPPPPADVDAAEAHTEVLKADIAATIVEPSAPVGGAPTVIAPPDEAVITPADPQKKVLHRLPEPTPLSAGPEEGRNDGHGASSLLLLACVVLLTAMVMGLAGIALSLAIL